MGWRMKNSSLLSLGLIASLGIAGIVSTSALAGPRRTFQHRSAAPAPGRPAERLALTPAQRAQIRESLQAEQDTITALLDELREASKNLRAAIRTVGATEESVRLASAAVAAVEADIAVERAKVYQQISP